MTPEAVWQEHEAAAKAIFAECGRALRGPAPGAMTFVEFRAELARLEARTAERLGRTRDDLKDRFEPEERRLKDMCGL